MKTYIRNLPLGGFFELFSLPQTFNFLSQLLLGSLHLIRLARLKHLFLLINNTLLFLSLTFEQCEFFLALRDFNAKLKRSIGLRLKLSFLFINL